MTVVMNADDGKVIQSFPISVGANAEVYEEKTGLIFVSTREGWVDIFHEDSPDHYSEAGKGKTEFGAKTMAYDPKADRIFVDTAEFGSAGADQGTPASAPDTGVRHVSRAGVCAVIEALPTERFGTRPSTKREVSLQLISGSRNVVEGPEGNVASD